MTVGLLVLWILVGWCGTPWPRRWPWPPPPPPDPWLLKVVNIVGGVVGGWAFNLVWSLPAGDAVTGVAAAATALGAFVGSVILGDLYGLVMSRQKG
jgi:hypothetical protein